MFLQVLFIFMPFLTGAKMATTHIHVHKESPFFLFEVTERKMWEIQAVKNSILRFNPGSDVHTLFEVPPSINMIPSLRVQAADVVVKEKIEGKNPQGVNYKAVFLKGWETEAYFMSSGNESIYVANSVGEYPQYDLSGKKVLHEVRDSFLFLNPNKLHNDEIRKIILNSPFRKVLIDYETQFKTSGELSVSVQPEKYVVSLKGMRGGPVFHVSKKNLDVKHHMER